MRDVSIAKRIVRFSSNDMSYSSSSLLEYGDDGIEETALNDSVDCVIDIVSEVAQRLPQGSTESATSIGRKYDDRARASVAGALRSGSQTGVDGDAVMVATERLSIEGLSS